ncbi:MAG: hypothetical protein ABEL97_14015 [Salinibacter sp.]
MRRGVAVFLLALFLVGGCSLAGPDGGDDSSPPSDGGNRVVVQVPTAMHL